ncbi:hypothetical protein Tco_0459817 [Tanacetum coccineum]
MRQQTWGGKWGKVGQDRARKLEGSERWWNMKLKTIAYGKSDLLLLSSVQLRARPSSSELEGDHIVGQVDRWFEFDDEQMNTDRTYQSLKEGDQSVLINGHEDVPANDEDTTMKVAAS